MRGPDRTPCRSIKQRGIAEPYLSPNAKDIPAAFKDPDGFWTGFSARARVLIVHKRITNKPSSILAYTDPRWKGRAVIANPLFGTTTTHVAALFLAWGDPRARKFMNDLKENGIKISTSNGESADLVAKGEVDFGLVDSDDAVNRMRQGKPVEMTCPDQATGQLGCLILPNAGLLLKDAPHPREAKRLIDYLLSRETERKLAFADCAQIPLHPGVETPLEVSAMEKLKTMPTDYAAIARKLQEIQPYLKVWVGYWAVIMCTTRPPSRASQGMALLGAEDAGPDVLEIGQLANRFPQEQSKGHFD